MGIIYYIYHDAVEWGLFVWPSQPAKYLSNTAGCDEGFLLYSCLQADDITMTSSGLFSQGVFRQKAKWISALRHASEFGTNCTFIQSNLLIVFSL